jgi:hypothetical protein
MNHCTEINISGCDHHSPFKSKLVVYDLALTTLITLCMKNCKKSVYGFPDEIQELILFHVGSFGQEYVERKDRVGEKRRVNFRDKEFKENIIFVSSQENFCSFAQLTQEIYSVQTSESSVSELPSIKDFVHREAKHKNHSLSTQKYSKKIPQKKFKKRHW